MPNRRPPPPLFITPESMSTSFSRNLGS